MLVCWSMSAGMASGSASISPCGRTSAAAHDDLAASLDYSKAITALQALARGLVCQTIEHFSDRVLDQLEQLYGPVPVRLELRKCAAPVPGFSGVVAVERRRHGAP